jgi:hypothetical protein
MERQFLELIKSASLPARQAEKITIHVLDFIEWKDNFTEFDTLKQRYEVMTETHIIEWMTIGRVYRFWLKNVKDKR